MTEEAIKSEIQRLRETRDALALRRELASLRLETYAMEDAAGSVVESFAEPGAYVDPRVWQTDIDGRVALGSRYLRGTRDRGANRPWWETESELLFTQSLARHIVDGTPYGSGVSNVLTNFIVGTGWEYPVSAAKKSDRTRLASVVESIQDTLDEFCNRTRWQMIGESELLRRGVRDGEALIRVFSDSHGRCEWRFIEPEYLLEPVSHSQRELEDFIESRHPAIFKQCAGPFDWSFGVMAPEGDAAKPLGYFIEWSPGGADWDFVPHWNLVHHKSNVDSTIKRGLSDFFATQNLIPESVELLRRIIRGAGAQAAIAYITEYEPGATREGVERMISSRETEREKFRVSSGQGERGVVDHYAGEAVHTPAGRKYHAGPLGTNQGPVYIEVLQAALRSVGVRWSMPEYLVSGDASNNNMASSMVAGSPFKLAVESAQVRYGMTAVDMLWLVVRASWFRGGLKEHAERAGVRTFAELKRLVNISVESNAPEALDRDKETDRNLRLVEAGIMAPSTAAARDNLDYEDEVAKGATKQATEIDPAELQGGTHLTGSSITESAAAESTTRAVVEQYMDELIYRAGGENLSDLRAAEKEADGQ